MSVGEELVLTCLGDDKLELLVVRDRGITDLLGVSLRRHDQGKTIQVDRTVLVNKEGAKALFAVLGAFLHGWED